MTSSSSSHRSFAEGPLIAAGLARGAPRALRRSATRPAAALRVLINSVPAMTRCLLVSCFSFRRPSRSRNVVGGSSQRGGGLSSSLKPRRGRYRPLIVGTASKQWPVAQPKGCRVDRPRPSVPVRPRCRPARASLSQPVPCSRTDAGDCTRRNAVLKDRIYR